MKTNAKVAYSVLAAVGLGIMIPVLAHDAHEAPAALPFDLDSPRRPSEMTAKYIGLETAEVDFGRVEEIVRLTGTVRPSLDRLFIITSAVSGTLARLDVRPGDWVKKGQVIGQVNSPELARLVNDLHKAEVDLEHASTEVLTTQSNIAQLEAQIQATRTQLRLAEEEVSRLQAGGEAVSANVLAGKQAAAAQARSQVTTLELSLTRTQRVLKSLEQIQQSTRKQIDSMRQVVEMVHAHPDNVSAEHAHGEEGGVFMLFAPTDGIVVRRDTVMGAGVEAGKPIVEIADLSKVTIEGELPESVIAKVGAAKGQAVRIRRAGSVPGTPTLAVGAVKGLSPTVDPIKRTAHLLIEADNVLGEDGSIALKNGMFVSLAVVLREQEDAVVAPASAVVNDGPMQFVFIKDGDAYVKRDVVPGYRDDRIVEIKEGLVPGDVVVTKGAYQLTQLRPKAAMDEHDHDHDHDHDHGHSH